MRLRPVLSACTAAAAIWAMSSMPAPAQKGPPPGLGSPCAPGGPGQYPPKSCGLKLGKTQIQPGAALTVSGAGFLANTRVNLVLGSPARALGSAKADSTGSFTMSVLVPEDAAVGLHTLAGIGTESPGEVRELTGAVNVVSTRDSGAQPRTGAPFSVPTGIAGGALVGVGAVALVAARRRRTPPA